MSQVNYMNKITNKKYIYGSLSIQYNYIDNIVKMNTIEKKVQEKITLKINKKQKNIHYMLKRILD